MFQARWSPHTVWEIWPGKRCVSSQGLPQWVCSIIWLNGFLGVVASRVCKTLDRNRKLCHSFHFLRVSSRVSAAFLSLNKLMRNDVWRSWSKVCRRQNGMFERLGCMPVNDLRTLVHGDCPKRDQKLLCRLVHMDWSCVFLFQSLKFSRFKLARGVVGMLHFGCHLGGTSVIQGLGEALALNEKGSRETDLTTKMASLY